MATNKKALKRHRQSVKRSERNRRYKTDMKTSVKEYLESLNEKNFEKSQKLLRKAESVIRHTASKGVIPKKRASRKIGRLVKKISALRS